MLRRRQKGDTLIEVLFAVTVLSLAIVLSLSIMNQGTAASLRSLQITLVRQQIDSQAEALRFLNAAYVSTYTENYAPASSDTSSAAEYYRIIQSVEALGYDHSVSEFGQEGAACDAAPEDSFIVNARQARYISNRAVLVPADSYAQLTYNNDGTIRQAQGVWVEGVRAEPNNGTSYIDFHIRACWGAPGTDVPMNIGTIVRLYDPAN